MLTSECEKNKDAAIQIVDLRTRNSSSHKAHNDVVSKWNIGKSIPRDGYILTEHEDKQIESFRSGNG